MISPESPFKCQLVADFPEELYRAPKFLITGKFPNLIQYTRMARGGHFAAMEVPELLTQDVINFVEKAEKQLNKVVKQEF
jgi:microsomal epoxide hydrolase